MKLTFGKHNGKDIRDVPREYIEWLVENCRKQLDEYEAELQRRDELAEASMSWMERIVTTGYKSLAKQNHPDTGGDGESMRQINSAAEELRKILRVREGGIVR